ncbi:MAG: hypothetical protein GWP08_03660 [Nitrospiraceae bacterium]|nr:hypothetical protein [Nitrospiraceae bacterium]
MARKKAAGCLGNALLALLSLLILFVVLEVAARVVLYTSGDQDRFARYASARQLQARPDLASQYLKYEPHRYLGYIPTPNYTAADNRHNSMGYRDDEIASPKPEGVFRIVCMGASTTYTPTIGHYKYAYPKLLEKELHERGFANVEVINAGVSAWTSYETLINFALRVVELDPDLIIVQLGINDVFARIVWPPEAYKSDNSGYRRPATHGVFMPSILEYSTLIRGVMIRLGLTQPHSRYSIGINDHHAGTFLGFEYERQVANGTYPQGVFKEVGLDEIFAANSADYFRRNLEHLVVLAKHDGVGVLLASIAMDSADEGKAGKRPLVSSPEFRAEWERANRTMAEVADKLDVSYFDFAAVFSKDDALYVDGLHVTFEGGQLKGKLFADYLVENRLVPPAAESTPTTPSPTPQTPGDR